MKAIVSPVDTRLKFPCLMENKKFGLIILMTDSSGGFGTGTVVRANFEHQIGEYQKDWTMSGFEAFTGKLELSN